MVRTRVTWKRAHLPKELRKVQAQRSQKSGAQVSRKAPAAIVTIDWVPESEFFVTVGDFVTRRRAGRLPAWSARKAMRMEPRKEPGDEDDEDEGEDEAKQEHLHQRS